MRIHHVGYLIQSMDEAINAFQLLGYEKHSDIVYDRDREIDICFMKNKEMLVELISPREKCRLFSALAKKIGNAPYHICYVTDNLMEEIETLEDSGWTIVAPPRDSYSFGEQKSSIPFS